jgi:predicted HTH domain antitoxin
VAQLKQSRTRRGQSAKLNTEQMALVALLVEEDNEILQRKHSEIMTKVEFTIPVHSVNNTIREEAETKAKEAYVMTLLKYGEISSGKASQLLGISRLDVIDLMSKYEISLFDDSMTLDEFQQEVNQAKMKLQGNNL